MINPTAGAAVALIDNMNFMKNNSVKGESVMKKNKGFSMVELIIVIAIMAILAGALAPALIKYINKSRLSADIQTGQGIASAITSALTDETIYGKVTGTDGDAYADWVSDNDSACSELRDELEKNADPDTCLVKSSKDIEGTSIGDGGFIVVVQPEDNVIQVYVGEKDPDHMVYPTVGKLMEKKAESTDTE